MVLKGLKEPQDKLQLIRVLSLQEVLGSIEEQTRGREDNTLFREGLGKVTNGLGLELCKLVEDVSFTRYITFPFLRGSIALGCLDTRPSRRLSTSSWPTAPCRYSFSG